MNKIILATFCVALITLLSCHKEENIVKPTDTHSSLRTDSNLLLIASYNNQSDTVEVDSFIATAIDFNLFELQAWSNSSLILDNQYSSLTVCHSNDGLKISIDPQRSGNIYEGNSSVYLFASQGTLQVSIQPGNINTSGSCIIGEDSDGI